ncbi:MAG: double zinc ribbon domain-containing protein [Gemmatimonadota bacterium]
MNECPECGALVGEGHASCPTCGHDLRVSTRTCAHCGETIAADAGACPACGHLATPARCDRHPDREAPGRCAICGAALCEECESGNRHYHKCPEHADVVILEGWAEVLSIPNEVEARLIEDNLRAEGVDSRILSQKDHSAFPVEFGDLARVRILVPTYAYEEAKRLIAGHSDALGEVSFGCPHCGEPYEEGEKVCGTCGEALI